MQNSYGSHGELKIALNNVSSNEGYAWRKEVILQKRKGKKWLVL
jgi:hypothetical protein